MIEGNGPKWLFDIDSLTQSMNYVSVAASTILNESTGTQGELNTGTSTQQEEISQDCIVMPIWKDASYFDSPSKGVSNGEPKSAIDDQKQVEDGPDIENDEKDKSEDDSSPKEVNTVGQHVNTTSPEVNTGRFKLNTVNPSVNTASSNDHDSPKDMFKFGASHTLEATHVEFFSDEDEPKIEPTSIVKALSDSSWVEVMQEELLQFKLQQGHRQEEGIDYKEVFAPVARIKAIRLFLAYASFMGFLVYQMDVKSAFLYETIKEEVYVTQPPGFKDHDNPDKIYKVVKALYGLHQAPRAWYETLANYLLGNVFKRGKIDQTLFIKKQKGDILLVQMSSMGELTLFLGLQVQQKEDGIFISQDKYVDEILKKFNYADVKSASTPVDLEKHLVKDGDANDVDVHLYRSMIGSLMYLTASRPNIMFAVCACARFLVTPKTSHLLAVKRIFRYLKGKPTLGLWYSRDYPFELVAYTDSDYDGATQDRKSTTGGSEYVAAASCCGQVLWIQNQLLDYGYNFMNTMIHIDNNSTICIIENPVQHSKTKHIEIRHHFIRDCNAKKLIQMVKIDTEHNVADLLTKGFNAGSQKEVGTLRYLSLVVPLKKVGDEAVHKELGDRMERAATTTSSLEAEQESDFLNSSHIKYALIENPKIHVSLIQQFWGIATARTTDDEEVEITASIDGQVKTITEASLRRHLKLEDSDVADKATFTSVDVDARGATTTDIGLDAGQGSGTIHKTLTRPHDSPFPRVHTLGSNEGSLQQNELMVLVTKLTNRVEVLENDMQQTKKVYSSSLTKLILRVKILEKKVKTNKARRRARIVISEDEDAEDDSSKQERKISDIDKDPTISLVHPEQDMEYDFDVSTAEGFTTASVPVTTASMNPEVSIAAANLVYIRRSAEKRKDKGKAIMKDDEYVQKKSKKQL
ncbi:putative ribonuclease H-like domain-containing protein, partial [Tanacetum coccineum]